MSHWHEVDLLGYRFECEFNVPSFEKHEGLRLKEGIKSITLESKDVM